MTDGHNFSTSAFAAALESVMKLSSKTALYNWLSRMENQGLIRKLDHGHYCKVTTELDDFLDQLDTKKTKTMKTLKTLKVFWQNKKRLCVIWFIEKRERESLHILHSLHILPIDDLP